MYCHTKYSKQLIPLKRDGDYNLLATHANNCSNKSTAENVLRYNFAIEMKNGVCAAAHLPLVHNKMACCGI